MQSLAGRIRTVVAVTCTAWLVAPAVADWREELVRPAPEFSQMPFWFWNDRLSETEIVRQMADFREHGVYGFVIHARMGLTKDIPTWASVARAGQDRGRGGSPHEHAGVPV